MNKDKKLLMGTIIGILVFILIVIVVVIMSFNTKSKNVKLTTNYKALIGVKLESDIILVINQKDKVSNILFLNSKSVSTLANQKIEGKSYDKAIELIVDKLKNKEEFNHSSNLYLIKYDNDSIYNKVLEQFNKQFVIYGVDKSIVEQTSSINFKLDELKISKTDNNIDNLKSLYDYSKKNLKSSN
ncbi:MAG: hypothetical protein Q4E39_02730 [bacterium]|nr:hypothetical protein [bacterium]